MSPLLQTMIAIAEEAAIEIMKVYERPFTVEFKGPEDPVTEADRIANRLITSRLEEAFPDIPVIAEEGSPETWTQHQAAERIFFVDPVDGTKEFIAKNGQFVVMIGLLEGERPTHGVLYAPALRTLWAGVVGQGAIRRGPDGEEALPKLKARSLSDARVVSSKSNQQSALQQAALSRLSARQTVPIGSAGLKAAAVADGSADIYLAPGFAGCLWDSCAPEALIRSVGGVYTDAHGDPLDYRATTVENHRGAVACSAALHREVVDRISDLLR